MRLIVSTKPGTLELNYTWLPTWIGINPMLLDQIDGKLRSFVVGKPLTDELLDQAHGLVSDVLQEMFPALPGLRDYLDSLKFVEPQ